MSRRQAQTNTQITLPTMTIIALVDYVLSRDTYVTESTCIAFARSLGKSRMDGLKLWHEYSVALEDSGLLDD